MAIHHWDPTRCDRNLLREFREVVCSLEVGETVEFPDGTFVDANEFGFFAGKGEDATQIDDLTGWRAAKVALEQSNYDTQLDADPTTEMYKDLGEAGLALLAVPGVDHVVRLEDSEGVFLERETVGSFSELVRVNSQLWTIWEEESPLPKFAVYTEEVAPGITFEILVGEISSRFWGAVATVLDLSWEKVEGVDVAVRMATDVDEQAVIEDFGSMLEQLQETYYDEMTGDHDGDPAQDIDPDEVEVGEVTGIFDHFDGATPEQVAIQMTKLPFVDYVDVEDGGAMLHLINGYFVFLRLEEDGFWQASTDVVKDGKTVPVVHYKPSLLEALSTLLADPEANLLSGTEFGLQVTDPLGRNVRFRDEIEKETGVPVWSLDLFSLPKEPNKPEIYADNGYTLIIMLTTELVYEMGVRSWDGKLNETQKDLVVEDVWDIVDFFKEKGLDETPTGD